MLESIISHHKKSASISYNAKSKAILHLQLLFSKCVKSSKYTFFFSVENSHFFLPLYRVIKKVKARCIKQKSEGYGPASAGALILDQKKVQPAGSRSLSVSGILHWREGKRRKRWWRVGGALSKVSTTIPPPPPIPLHESAKTLFFGT